MASIIYGTIFICIQTTTKWQEQRQQGREREIAQVCQSLASVLIYLPELYKVLGKKITAIIFFITAKTKAKKKAGAKKGGRVASELLLKADC